ncbi:MAG: hypothetical protein VKO39_13775 [Cyanobacteriota bacterium]|nr:hypothetical protein [Cyanobacteriota bacterium]
MNPFHKEGALSLESKIRSGCAPEDYSLAVGRGLNAASREGMLAGDPVVDVKAMLISSRFDANHSSPSAFESAAKTACKQLREAPAAEAKSLI